MIRKLLQKVFKPRKQTHLQHHSSAQKFTKRAHHINKQHISDAALKTTEGLQNVGF